MLNAEWSARPLMLSNHALLPCSAAMMIMSQAVQPEDVYMVCAESAGQLRLTANDWQQQPSTSSN